MPKGRQLKRYLLKEVTKVVRGRDSGVIGICQNTDRASSFVNTFASDIASVYTAGRM